jgi:ABC-type dipeptide/oligopeptide/nickel transport system permease subunit
MRVVSGPGRQGDDPDLGAHPERRAAVLRQRVVGVFPGLAIMLVVLSINFVGDGLADLMNVKESQGVTG